MEISLIAAIDKKNGIGLNNDLLCRIKEDMQWFKDNTEGKPVIMGRKTYESIGVPLKGRTNIVLTHKLDYNPHPNVLVFKSILEALDEVHDQEEVMIIGGSSIYRQTLPLADRLYITEFDKKFKADAYFPEIDKEVWTEVMSMKGKEDVGFDYYFKLYEKT